MKEIRNKNSTIISIHDDVKGEFEIIGQTLVVKLGEDLDHHNSLHIENKLTKSSWTKYQVYYIWFSGTDFMDSSGIGLLWGVTRKWFLLEGSVYVTGVSNNVDRIFKLSGLYKIIEKYNKVEEVLELIKSKGK